MKPKYIEIQVNGRIFQCYYGSEYGGRMCTVSIYEVVRPKWKIFRTSYRAYKTFWVEDYHSIKGGVSRMVRIFLQEENEEAKRLRKWRELTNG